MKIFIRSLFLALFVLAAMPAAPVHAQSLTLQQAQQQGLVGEQQDGYLGIVTQAPGVQTLVDDINLKRRQIYRDIARKNNINLQAVEALAGKKAIEKAGSGEIVQGNEGQWVKKP